MKRRLVLLVLIVFVGGAMIGQDVTPRPTPARKRGWLSRILHPFSPNVVPQYKDPRLRGLALDLQITPQTVKLSEVRQLSVKVTLANLSKRPVTLDFPTTQRIEIYLTNSAGDVLTKWSENHAIAEKAATLLINPSEGSSTTKQSRPASLRPTKFLSPRFSFLNFWSCAFGKSSWQCLEPES